MAGEKSDIDTTLAKIALKIKKLRKDKGYSSYETFAVEYDLDRKQYWRIEKGTNITISTLLKVLAIHQMPLKEFFEDIEA
jgi:transcriptional regulator with XRE-family HTH domain